MKNSTVWMQGLLMAESACENKDYFLVVDELVKIQINDYPIDYIFGAFDYLLNRKLRANP